MIGDFRHGTDWPDIDELVAVEDNTMTAPSKFLVHVLIKKRKKKS